MRSTLKVFTYVFPIVQGDTYLHTHAVRNPPAKSAEKKRTVSHSTKSSGGRHSGSISSSGSTSSTGCAISTESSTTEIPRLVRLVFLRLPAPFFRAFFVLE